MQNSIIVSDDSEKNISNSEKLVSTKELAQMLGVDVKTIQRVVTSLDINVERVGSSHTMMFNEQQATLIKIELQNHSKLSRNGFNTVSISNDLEMMLMQQKLSEYQNMRIQQLTSELNNANAQLIEQKPKADVYDQLVDRSKCINFRDFATKIGFTQNEFMTILKSKYIYKNSVGEYRAYSEYQKYFTLRTFSKGVDKTGEQLMLNMDGITYFTEKYKPGAIAESYLKKETNYLETAIKNCPESDKTFVDKIKTYTYKQVAKLVQEDETTIKYFCRAEGWIDENCELYELDPNQNKYITPFGKLTEEAKNIITATFFSVRDYEKGMKKSSCGKGE